VIEAVGLTRSFGGRAAIRNVSFTVGKGEILGFLGPNGAGKTTTLRILTCYLPADSGTARIDGLDVLEDSIEVRKRIGYLPENPPLYREMIVRDFLMFVAKIRWIPAPRRKAMVQAAIERCGLAGVERRLIGNLSKGFRQRVGLAQAMVHDPPILILDEPTVGLDPEQIVEIRGLIRSLGGDHTVILSTHMLPEVAVTCSRVAIISYGEIVQEGSLEGLAEAGRDHEQIRLRVARDSQDVRRALAELPWTRAVRAGEGPGEYFMDTSREGRAREEISRLTVESGWGLLELTPVTRSLEEIYLEATRRLPGREGETPPGGAPAAEEERERSSAAAAAGGGRP